MPCRPPALCRGPRGLLLPASPFASGRLQFIAAAGNSKSSIRMYPAAYNSPAIIAVTAIDSTGSLHELASYGPWVHLGAPGDQILSTYPEDNYILLR